MSESSSRKSTFTSTVTAILGFLGGGTVGAIAAYYGNSALEWQKFRYSVVKQVVDLPSADDRAAKLRFLIEFVATDPSLKRALTKMLDELSTVPAATIPQKEIVAPAKVKTRGWCYLGDFENKRWQGSPLENPPVNGPEDGQTLKLATLTNLRTYAGTDQPVIGPMPRGTLIRINAYSIVKKHVWADVEIEPGGDPSTKSVP